jgi:hypothetical protein
MHRWTPTSISSQHAIHISMVKTKRTNQIMEDMLRAFAMMYGKSWDKSLPYAEFSHNSSYQASVDMAPFEALYG